MNPFFVHVALGVALAAVPASAALAAADPSNAAPSPSPAPSASPAALTEIGRVVTADRHSEPIGQTSRPTFVVDRTQIDQWGAWTVTDALQGVPGMTLFRYGPFGSLTDYGIRGSLPTQTLVLIDGAPIADPSVGEVYLSSLSTIGVDRIEVVESGSSTLYGTSASGGVINVITHVPRGTYAEVSDGSFADRDLRFGAGNGIVGFTLERHVSSGDYSYPAFSYGSGACDFYGPPCSFPAGVRANSYGDESAGRLNLDVPLAGGWRLRGRVDADATTVGVPGELTYQTPDATQFLSTDTALLELERAARTSSFSLSLSGAGTRQAYNDPQNGGEDDVYTSRSQVSLKDVLTARAGDAVVGVDLSRETAALAFPTPPDVAAAQSQAAAYVQLGASPFAGSRFTAGLRAEHDSPNAGVLDPSFGGVVRSGAFKFAGNVAESFRVPTLQDLYYPGFSNPNLVPEKSLNGDATVSYRAAQGATLSLGWFGRSGSNFIVYDPVSNIPVNARRAQLQGLAFTVSTQPLHGIVVSANGTDLYDSRDLTTGARLPRTPVLQATLDVGHPFAAGRVSYGIRWGIVGSDGDDAANVPPPVTGSYDAYDSFDAYLRYKLDPHAVLSVRGFNLFNEASAPVFGYPSPGRRMYVEVSTR